MPTPRPSTSRRVVIWTIAVLIVVGVFYVAHIATRTVLEVRAYTVERTSILSSDSTNGKVQPVHNYEAHAPFPGLVKAVYVHEGQKVRRGELLLTLDDTDARARLAQAQASLVATEANEKTLAAGGDAEQRYSFAGQLSQARTEEAGAQQSLTTLQALAAQGAASQAELDQAKNRLSNDRSNLQVLEQQQGARRHPSTLPTVQAQVAEAQASVNSAQSAISQSMVRAPMDGTVYSLAVAQSDYVQQGDRLLQMADLNHLEVLAYFDEPDIGKLHIGAPVTITWVAEPNRTWRGKIIQLPATVVNYTTRNVGELLCSIDDQHDGLLPDTNVVVNVTTASVPNALVVPREALHIEQGLNYVYLVKSGKLKRSHVVIGTINTTQVQILSGIGVGDQVGLSTLSGRPLTSGSAVQVVQ
jgi:HlyD family secretion protein